MTQRRIDYTLAIQANTAAMVAVEKAIQQIGATSTTQFGAMQRAIDGAHASTTQLGQTLAVTLGGLAQQAIQKTIGMITDIGTESLGAAGNIEQMRVRFAGLLGSQQAANAEIRTLQNLANNSAFTLPGLVQAETRLLGVGKSAAEARTLLQAIGDTVAGVGGSSAVIDEVTVALSQMASKGHVMSQELNQLAERGIPALQILAKALGITTAEASKLVETGKVSADTFIRAFETNAVERFSGAMQRQAGTWEGLLSTAGDLKTTFEAAFGQGVIEALEPTVKRLLDDLQNPATVANLVEMGKQAGILADGLFRAADGALRFLGITHETTAAQKEATAAQLALTTNQSAANAALANLTAYQGQTNATTATAVNLERISRLQQAARAESSRDIDALRLQEQSLERQWRLQDQIANLNKARGKLAADQALAGDIFSSAGQGARDRLAEDRDRVTEIQQQMGRDREKQAIDDTIRRRGDALDRTLAGLDRERQAVEDAATVTKVYASNVKGIADYLKTVPARWDALLSAGAALSIATIMAASTGGGALRDANLSGVGQQLSQAEINQVGAKTALDVIFSLLSGQKPDLAGSVDRNINSTRQDSIVGAAFNQNFMPGLGPGGLGGGAGGYTPPAVTVNVNGGIFKDARDLTNLIEQTVANTIRRAAPAARR